MFINVLLIILILTTIIYLHNLNKNNKKNHNNEEFNISRALKNNLNNLDNLDNLNNINLEVKKVEIIPILKKEASLPDIINFIFFMQDYYEYNPQAYEEMVDNINEFFEMYKIIMENPKNIYQYYTVAVSRKDNALNSLHSLIYSLPESCDAIHKFNEAHKNLNIILNKYVNEMYQACEYYLKINGYDITRRVINTGPREYNIYFDTAKDFTYQFY